MPVDAVWSFKRHQWELGSEDDRGRLHGINRNWSLDGSLRSEVAWKHGVMHGPARFLHKDGSLMTEGVYVEGCADGVWIYRSGDDGSKIQKHQGSFYTELDASLVVHVFNAGRAEASFQFDAQGQALDGDDQRVSDPPTMKPGEPTGFDLVEGRWRTHPALEGLL